VLTTFIRNYETHGTVLSLRLVYLFLEDMAGLLLLDGAMVLTMFPIWWWEIIVSKGFCPWRSAELFIQHAYQTTWFLTFLYLILQRNWPWVQTAFVTLHTISMLMKIHSYGAQNSHFHQLDLKSRKLKKQIDSSEDESKTEQLQQDLDEIEADLKPGNVRYPANLTWWNWIDWLMVPTFVYELFYPRTDHFRLWYLVEKIAATLGTFWLLYIIIEHYIIPVTRRASIDSSFLQMLPHLLFPFLIAYLLIFYILFECIANGVAEITKFADRSFYDDWWNSITWDEFARKWNKPVHHFLLRHVYLPLRLHYKLPKFYANLCTFLFSAVIHELAVIIVARRIRMYFFMMQMSQIPLIMAGERIGKWGMTHFGNWFFWIGMMIGPALLTYAYTWEVFAEEVEIISSQL